jgi:ATP-dependent Clp protease protease subunit
VRKPPEGYTIAPLPRDRAAERVRSAVMPCHSKRKVLMARSRSSNNARRDDETHDIAVVGELDECEADVIAQLLELDDGAECTLYIDSGGGRVYSALAIMSIILLKQIRAKGIVLGACSSAALLVLAACRDRVAMPYSIFQFHPIRWESGEDIERVEASEWARHFMRLEEQCDELLARLLGADLALVQEWSRLSRYVSGQDMVDAGVLQIVDPTRSARPHSRTTKG